MDFQRIDRKQGFTLIEVMIVVAIVAILAAIALPSYQSQTRDARRKDCTAVLMQARQQMERFYSKNYTYATAVAADISAKCPIDGGATYYNLALSNQTATTFLITATPTAAQSSDACGNLTINQAGQKGSAGTIDDCWR